MVGAPVSEAAFAAASSLCAARVEEMDLTNDINQNKWETQIIHIYTNELIDFDLGEAIRGRARIISPVEKILEFARTDWAILPTVGRFLNTIHTLTNQFNNQLNDICGWTVLPEQQRRGGSDSHSRCSASTTISIDFVASLFRSESWFKRRRN